MRACGIRGWDHQRPSPGIKLGDLLCLEDYFFDEIDKIATENMFGIVYRFANQDVSPRLLEVLWPDGSLETLYEDEVRILTGGS